MPDSHDYIPPKVWSWTAPNGGTFANINRAVAGPTHDKELPIGRHPLQLYSLATPNGMKVTIMLEELLALGYIGAEYDAWLIKIGDGDQFGSGFTAVNPNSKDPCSGGSLRLNAHPCFYNRAQSCSIWLTSSAPCCLETPGPHRGA